MKNSKAISVGVSLTMDMSLAGWQQEQMKNKSAPAVFVFYRNRENIRTVFLI